MWEQVSEDKGIWTEYEYKETGKKSLQLHELKTVWKSCKPQDHYFEITGNREATCTKCHMVRSFVAGKEIFKDGKFLPLK